MLVPPLETERLTVRPFTVNDLDAVCNLLGTDTQNTRDARRRWLEWTILGYEQHAALYQPPYGERAITLRATGEVVGAVGFVPCLDAFGQLPFAQNQVLEPGKCTAEMGLFWSVLPTHQNQGYATEAARALVEYAFTHLHLARIVATTERDNLASQAVMRKLQMRIERNPFPTPPYLQVVGVSETIG